MFSFFTPCLRWKLVLATKGQYGWPGFLAPNQTRYLNKLVTITTQSAFGGGNPTVRQQAWVTNRLTGNITSADGNENADAIFPYGQTPDSSWVSLTETYAKQIVNNGVFIITTEITLSNEYTFVMLDADTNALLSSVSVASMPWNSLVVAAYPEISIPLGPYTPTADLFSLLPPQVVYPGITAPGPNNIPQLNAAAWAIWAPGTVAEQNWFPNGYSKLISYIAMTGNYCQKNVFLDYEQNILDQTCQSGIGSCANPFKIIPPPIFPGENAYVMLVPNCQCGA